MRKIATARRRIAKGMANVVHASIFIAAKKTRFFACVINNDLVQNAPLDKSE